MSNPVPENPNILNYVPPTDPSRCTIPLVGLPLELRELIYRAALFPDCHNSCACHIQFSDIDVTRGRGPRHPYWLPEICKVNRATRTDVGLYLIRHMKFDILYTPHLDHFVTFLGTFPENYGFESVRRMNFPLFGRHQPKPGEPNLYFEFLKCCPRLTEIRIKLEAGDFLKVRRNTFRNVDVLPTHLQHSSGLHIMTCDKIIDAYRFKELFTLADSLNKVTIRVWRRVWVNLEKQMEMVLHDCLSEMVDLAEWLKMGFLERGRRVDVKVVEADTPGLDWRRRSE